jgi:hypothetical protein
VDPLARAKNIRLQDIDCQEIRIPVLAKKLRGIGRDYAPSFR